MQMFVVMRQTDDRHENLNRMETDARVTFANQRDVRIRSKGQMIRHVELKIVGKIIIDRLEKQREKNVHAGQIQPEKIRTVQENRLDDRLRTRFIALVKPETLLQNVVKSTQILRLNEFVALATAENGAERRVRLGQGFVHQPFVLQFDRFVRLIVPSMCVGGVDDGRRSARPFFRLQKTRVEEPRAVQMD